MENIDQNEFESCHNDKCESCGSRIQRNASEIQMKSSKVEVKQAGDEIECGTRTDGNHSQQTSLKSSYGINVHSKVAERIRSEIRNLEKKSGAKIEVKKKKCTQNEFTLSITGKDKARKEARKLIEDIAKEKVSNSPDEIETICMEKENLFLGSDTVNENRDKDRCHRCTSRILENSFQFEVNKVSEVGEKAAEDQIVCDTTANDNLLQTSLITSCYVDIHRNLVERTIGLEGCHIQRFEEMSGTEIKVVSDKTASDYTRLHISGRVEALNNAKKLLEKLAKPKVKYSPGKIQCLTKNSDNILQTSLITSCYMNIPAKLAESITGNEDCQIEHLEEISGADIKVIEYNVATNYMTLRITGTVETKKKAKELIDDITKEANKKLPNRSVEIESPFMKSEKLHLLSDTSEKKYLTSFPPIIKDFYKEDRIVASMTNEEVDYFRYCNFIFVKSRDPQHKGRIPKPVTSFEQAFQYYPELLEQLFKQGFTSPSGIQCQAWPIIMKGYDMVGISPAETGKTLAVLFPALIHIKGQATTREDTIGPSVLILAPTKEAVQRIYGEVSKYEYFGIKSICIFDRSSEKYDMKEVDLLITTPEHIYDEDMNNAINITEVTFLVLDYANQMIKFQSQLCKLASDINPNRQVVCLSRILSRKFIKLFSWFMIEPIRVFVKKGTS